MGLGLLGRALAGAGVGYAKGKEMEFEQQAREGLLDKQHQNALVVRGVEHGYRSEELSEQHKNALALEQQRLESLLSSTAYKQGLEENAKGRERQRTGEAIKDAQTEPDRKGMLNRLGQSGEIDARTWVEATQDEKPLVVPEGGSYVDKSGKVIYKNPKTFAPDNKFTDLSPDDKYTFTKYRDIIKGSREDRTVEKESYIDTQELARFRNWAKGNGYKNMNEALRDWDAAGRPSMNEIKPNRQPVSTKIPTPWR